MLESKIRRNKQYMESKIDKSKVVKLKLVRNRKIREEKSEVGKHLVDFVKGVTKRTTIAGYAIVTWEEDAVATDTGWYHGNMPERLLPSFVKDILSGHIAAQYVQTTDV